MKPAGTEHRWGVNLEGEAGRNRSLPWLRWLRWTAVAGQSMAVLTVSSWLGIRLPLASVWSVIGLTAVTNLALHAVPRGRGEDVRVLAGVMTLDVVLLTALLHFTGGPHNPFSSFYLVHVALAAVILPLSWAGFVAVICCAGFALLYIGAPLLPRVEDVVCGIGPDLPMPTHLRGMLVAFVLTALCVAFFVNRLQRTLSQREAELAAAREVAAQHEHFAALATLAAGAAHELGTPIGTIAIAAGELARTAKTAPGFPDVMDDAELIRQQAARCRDILDRLQNQAGDMPRSVTVAELCAGLRSRFQDAEIHLETREAPQTVVVPPESFVQALASLVKNALDAQNGKGPVLVRVSKRDGRVSFAVVDQGVGVRPDIRKRAGEPFFTTKPPGKGMGLGLFLVKVLAQRVRGDFRLETLDGGGTAAVLEFPETSA